MKPVCLIALCMLALTAAACAPTYTANAGNPYDFKGDLNNLGAPVSDAPAQAPHKSLLDQLFG